MSDGAGGFYEEDLAYVHSAAFADVSLAGGAIVLERLAAAAISRGLIVDLGCGSGEWAAMAAQAGFDVLGVDVSANMLNLARERVPSATFVESTLYDVELPSAAAITAFGEGLGYAAPQLPDMDDVRALFARGRASLVPGGLFVFDVIVGGEPMTYRSWTERDDFAVLVNVTEQVTQRALTREIIVFRKVGDAYRRSAETHRQRIFDESEVRAALEDVGFGVATQRTYGERELGPRRLAFVAQVSA